MFKPLDKYRWILVPVVLILAACAGYWPILQHEFVRYDDDKYVTENPQVKGGITRESVLWAFRGMHSSMWHPVTSLSHILDCQMFELNPAGHHLTSLLIHIGGTLLLFWVFKETTGEMWLSGFVAAVFALHPLQTESVAWVAERKSVLSGFFWMLTMLAYVRYAKRPTVGRYLLLVLVFVFCIMTKPVVVTLPLVLLLLDYWPLGRLRFRTDSAEADYIPGLSPRRLIAEKVPLFVLSVVLAVITYIAQRSGGVVFGVEELTLESRAANAVISYLRYIGKMIWPSKLAVLYPHPHGGFSIALAVICALVLAVVSVGFIRAGRRRKYLAVGWLWFIVTLVPVIGLVQAGEQAMANRYMYVPIIGLSVITGWGARDLLASWRYKRRTLALSAAVMLSAAFVCTRWQLRHWHNSVSLFEYTLGVTENNFIIHNDYATVLKNAGKIDEAIEHYNRCLELRPDSYQVHTNLGNALSSRGDSDKAVMHYRRAVELVEKRRQQGARLSVGVAEAYYNLANFLRIQARYGESARYYGLALELTPEDVDALNGMGMSTAALNRFDEAIDYFNRVLALEPGNVFAHGQRGLALTSAGRLDEAISEFRTVLRARPGDAQMHTNVGIVLEKQGKIDEAIKYYRQALAIDPENPTARQLLEAAPAKQQQKDSN